MTTDIKRLDNLKKFFKESRELQQKYGRLIHDYGMLNLIAGVPAVKTALLQAADTIRKARVINNSFRSPQKAFVTQNGQELQHI